MWEINSSEQISAFLYSLCLGVIFCLFYDIFRALRFAIKFNDIFIFLQDIFYFVSISFVTFLFLLAFTNGEIRFYVIFGILIGFLICYFTFSKYFLKLLKIIFKAFALIYKKINTILNRFFVKTGSFIKKILNIIKNTFKKGLKMIKGLLYTKK